MVLILQKPLCVNYLNKILTQHWSCWHNLVVTLPMDPYDPMIATRTWSWIQESPKWKKMCSPSLTQLIKFNPPWRVSIEGIWSLTWRHIWMNLRGGLTQVTQCNLSWHDVGDECLYMAWEVGCPCRKTIAIVQSFD